MSAPKPLSPAAQAVMDAYYRTPCQNRLLAAAVLRAVANQWRGEIGPLPVTGRTTGINDCADSLCEIATELEGHQPDPPAGWQAIDPGKEAAAIAIARELRGPYG